MTDAAFAAQILVTQQAVGMWRRGERMPGPEHVRRVEQFTAGAVTRMDLLHAWQIKRLKRENGVG
jgi:DNA-binding transcriptional regulator YdaS (Cro superfamily)